MMADQPVTITIRVEDEAVRVGLKKAAQMIDRDAAGILADYAERRIVPTARSLAPRIISQTLAAKKTARRGAVLTTTARGMKRRIVGMTNFGGGGDESVNYPIRPKKRKALRLRDGRIVAAVTGPRRARGMHYLENAIEKHHRETIDETKKAVTEVMRRRIIGISR